MEQGIKIVLVIMGLLIIAFGVIYLLSDRILNLNKQAENQQDRSSESFSSMKCILGGGSGYYTKDVSCGSLCSSNGLGLINDDLDGDATDGDCGYPPGPADCCCTGPAMVAKKVISLDSCKGDCGTARSVLLTNCPSIGAALDICCCRCV